MLTAADLKTGQMITTADYMTLTVGQTGWDKGTAVEDVLEGRAAPTRALATQDGRAVLPGWHEGHADAEDWVYYERYDLTGRAAHGWVHRETRQLLQAG